MLSLLLVLACTGSSDLGGGADATLDLAAAPAFDPILGGPLSITADVDSSSGGDVRVVVLDASGAEIWSTVRHVDGPSASLDVEWDGLRASGSRATAGAYTLEAYLAVSDPILGADLHVGTVTRPLHLVRCAFDAAYADDDGGETATRVPLYWSGPGLKQDVGQPFARIAKIDADDGTSADFAAVPDGLEKPGMTEPIAYQWDSRPIVSLQPGDSVLLNGNGLDGAGVTLDVPGWTVISGDPLASDAPIVLQRDEPLSDTLGVVDEDLALTFVATADDGSTYEIGTQHLPMRFYALLGPSGFDAGDDVYAPWVAAIDPALRAIQGTAPDHDAVIDALVDWIYNQSGLSYDTRYGASAYVEYRGSGWTDAHFYFGSFLKRKYGDVVNCTDCASILLTYANMLGATLNYTIILQNFDLNYILAIGGDEFTECPFGPGGCGFSYHAVTTDDAGGTIWDATLALDGDADPGATPNTVLEVRSIEGGEYLDRLAKGGAAYYYESQGTIQ